MRQVDEVRVSTAADISRSYILNQGTTPVHGNPVRGHVSLSCAGGGFNLVVVEDFRSNLPYEVVSLFADACEIKDPSHCSLLHMALTSSDLQGIDSTFAQQGIYIKGLVFGGSKGVHQGQRDSFSRIPSPFVRALVDMNGTSRSIPDAMRPGPLQGTVGVRTHGKDRRLPLIQLTGGGGGSKVRDSAYRPLPGEGFDLDGWEHVQHLGEHMVSKVFQTQFQQLYNPERDWTSRFRSRSGYIPYQDTAGGAPFTFRDQGVLAPLTTFLIKHGSSETPNWTRNLLIIPQAYHVDLAVSPRGGTSSFVITTAQLERMRRFRMHDVMEEPTTEVAVLIRVSDVYSEDSMTIDILVDPWRLLNSNDLRLEGGWVIKGAMHRDNMRLAGKRRRLHNLTLPWAMLGTPEREQTVPHSLRDLKVRDTYSYRALAPGNMRLLYLLPGEVTDQLQGVIIHVSFESSDTYLALSYVWGSDQQTEALLTPDGIIGITKSLDRALRGVRHESRPIMLWADAICINQNDNQEKSHQIRLLPKVFQNAEATYAFLDGCKECDSAVEMLMQVRIKAVLDDRSKSRAQETIDWPEYLPKVPASWGDQGMPPPEDDIWIAVRKLFALPWFRRVWIIQEVVAAPKVKIVCGKWVLDWDDLHRAVELVDGRLQMYDDADNDCLSQVRSWWEPFVSLAIQREWEARQVRWSLIALLENFRYVESKFCRDRLFALLGLASDGNEAAFEPCYDSKLEEVVLKFAREFVRQGRGMRLLCRAGLNLHSERFPSWVPDWTARRPSSLHESSEHSIVFAASGPQHPSIHCSPDTDELLVAGYDVDVIESISSSSNVELEWASYFEEVDSMVDSAVLSPVKDSRDDLKWKVPIASMLYAKLTGSEELDLQTSYRALRSCIENSRKGNPWPEIGRPPDGNKNSAPTTKALEKSAVDVLHRKSRGYVSILQDVPYGWRFVVTRRGFVGIVPKMAKVGDSIAILKGGQVPFILQQSETRAGTLRLVGEGYIHGIMNGEGLSLPGVVESDIRIH